MSFKTILVPASSAEASKTALDTALLVARRWNSHLEVLHVRADPRGLVPYTGEGMDGSMIEEIMDVTEREGVDRATQTKAMFDEFCAEHNLIVNDTPSADAGVTVSWREEAGREDEIVALQGRLYDLIVVGRPVSESPLPSPITLEAAFTIPADQFLLRLRGFQRIPAVISRSRGRQVLKRHAQSQCRSRR